MARAATVDVAEALETRKVGTFQIGIWFLACLILFIDGFDLSGALVGAPAFLRHFQAQRSELGVIFGLSGLGGTALWVAAVPYVITAAICVALGVMHWQRFAGEADAAAGGSKALETIDSAALKLQA